MENSSRLRKVVVLGCAGQVGRAYLSLPSDLIHGTQVTGLNQEEFDFLDPQPGLARLSEERPDAVINAAAYTQVDAAETDRETAHRINAEIPGLIAQWCAEREIPFVHFSTDYVYPGTGTTPWQEKDTIQPLNYYGQTKADGDALVARAGGKYLIFRTSWVYDAQGKNFVNTMLNLAMQRETLSIVQDQVGAPSYAPDLASASFRALQQAIETTPFPSGTYHLVNEGETNWFEFAREIFALTRNQGVPLKITEVKPIASSDYPTPAIRPHNSRLNTHKFYQSFGFKLPHWREGLISCLKEKF